MECSLENITVHYEELGEGKPIIILPGWSLNTRFMAYIMEPYFQNRDGWQRIYIDPPGHGKTPGKEWITDQDKILEVVLACIDKLTEGKRFCLIGASLGGYQVRGVRRFRADLVDGIAMIVPAIITEDNKRTVPPHRVLVEEPGIQAEIAPAEMDFYEMAVVHTRKWLDYQRGFPQVPEEELGDFEFLSSIRDRPEKYALSFDVDDVEPFPGPSLIVTGRQDSSVGYRDAWNIIEKYPRATYVVLDRASHELEEKGYLVSALVNDWLDRVEEYAALKITSD